MSVLSKCDVCGKVFLYDPQTLYKFSKYHTRPSMACCSYKCYLAEQRLREDIRQKIKEDKRLKARKKSSKI